MPYHEPFDLETMKLFMQDAINFKKPREGMLDAYYRDKSEAYYKEHPTYIEIAYSEHFARLPPKHQNIKVGQVFRVLRKEKYNDKPEQDRYVIMNRGSNGNSELLYFRQADVFLLNDSAKYEAQERAKRFRRQLDI